MNRIFQRCAALAAAAAALSSLRLATPPVRADSTPSTLDLWTFGYNRVGQCGQVAPNPGLPSPMHEARHWVAVSAGHEYTLALTAEGDVYAWGANSAGQLGDGTTKDSALPVAVKGPSGVTMIAAGGAHALAYRASDATLWAWGDNTVGAIAQPESVSQSSLPVQIVTPGPLQAIAAGGTHSLALATDGTVYAWGGNTRGQLGTGDVTLRWTPTPVPMPGKVIAIGAGAGHSLAVTEGDGQVWTWGWNVFGALGTGLQGQPTEAFPNPVKAVGVVGVDQVAGGDFHSLAKTTDGHVFGWGYNTEGQVGNGAMTPANTGVLTPVLLDGIDSVAAIDANGIDSIALRTNGEVWTWGDNQYGVIGANTRGFQHVPVQVSGSLRATAVAIGSYHAVVLAEPRPVAKVLELGDSTSSQAPLTLPLVRERSEPSDVAGLSAGFHHVLALDGKHRVWSWGDDSFGQLGTPDGAHADPELVDIPLDGARGFVQVAARADQSFALRSDGVVFAWGDNTHGALGLGAAVQIQLLPARVDGLPVVTSVAAGERHTLALGEDGHVWAMGENVAGQLGTRPSKALVTSPVEIPSFFGNTWIAAGGFHSAAINAIGNLLLWGDGSRAQLGTGNINGTYVPTTAMLAQPAMMVSLGRFHSLVVVPGGGVYSFGDYSACQLGEGVLDGAWTPMAVELPGTAAFAAAGDYDSLVVDSDGSAYAWGDDSRGALGVAGPPYSHLECRAVSPVVTGKVVLAAGGGAFSVLAVTP